VITDVVLHEFRHQAVDSSTGGGQALESIRARIVLVEGAKDAFELADDFFGAVNQVQFFSRCM
jgi:hypothetical protein